MCIRDRPYAAGGRRKPGSSRSSDARTPPLTQRRVSMRTPRASMSNGSTIANIKPTDLRGILKYVPRFQGQIFVIALDGAIVADDNFGNLLIDIAVLRSLGIKVVLVHGIGQQI